MTNWRLAETAQSAERELADQLAASRRPEPVGLAHRDPLAVAND